MPAIKRGDLTMSDIVLLRLLSERPMHGHQAAIELERQQLSIWTGISRPQVYWSLNKLLKLKLIRPIKKGVERSGRQRRVFAVTRKSKAAINKAFRRGYWSTQNLRPPFLEWMLLASTQVSPDLLADQITRRRKFLEHELSEQRKILTILNEQNSQQEALIVGLHAEQMQLELHWLENLPHVRDSQQYVDGSNASMAEDRSLF